jgi:hypothetical protein
MWPLRWFRLYLTGRTRYIRRGCVRSQVTAVACDIPQGVGFLGRLCSCYTQPMWSGSSFGTVFVLIYRLCLWYSDLWPLFPGQYRQPCITYLGMSEVADWMRSSRLQLNSVKTELLWCSMQRLAGKSNLLPDPTRDFFAVPVSDPTCGSTRYP